MGESSAANGKLVCETTDPILWANHGVWDHRPNIVGKPWCVRPQTQYCGQTMVSETTDPILWANHGAWYHRPNIVGKPGCVRPQTQYCGQTIRNFFFHTSKTKWTETFRWKTQISEDQITRLLAMRNCKVTQTEVIVSCYLCHFDTPGLLLWYWGHLHQWEFLHQAHVGHGALRSHLDLQGQR